MSKQLIDRKFPWLASLWRFLRDSFRYATMRPEVTEFGFRMLGKDDLDTSRIQSSEHAAFKRLLSESDIFVDIGANVGLFTMLAAEKKVPVISCEPHPQTFRLLCRNLHMNGFEDVEAHACAIGDRTRICSLFGGGQGASLNEGWGGIHSTYETVVPCITLEALIGNRFQDLQMLFKVDAEGAEFDILSQSPHLLNRKPKPIWIIENSISRNYGPKKNPNYKSLFDLFWRNGYEAYTVESDRPGPISKETRDSWFDAGYCPNGVNYIFRESKV